MKINPATGAVGAPITVGAAPKALAFDGTSIWVANFDSNSVMKINPATGVVGAPIAVGAGPIALAYDGSSIWVANKNSNSVTKLATSGLPVGVQQLDVNAVTTANIADGAVTSAKIALPLILSGADASGPLFSATNINHVGVEGGSTTSVGVFGHSTSNYGVYGTVDDISGAGVYGLNSVTGASGLLGGDHGVQGLNANASRAGVYGLSTSSSGYGVYGENTASGGFAGYFKGLTLITGQLIVTGKTSGIVNAAALGALHGQNDNVVGYGVHGSNSATGAAGYLGAGSTGVVGTAGTGAGTWAGYFTGNVNVTGTVTANGSLLTSDLRLKTDIQPLNNTLDKVLKLRGVSYVMKADETKERKIGVIAQELEQEYPELVATDDKGMKSVAYASLTAVLIEAVKGLKAENEILRTELAEIRKIVGTNKP